MKCRADKNKLMAYVEGELSEAERKSVSEHLAACESCAREVEALESTVKTLRGAEYPALSPASNLRSRVMAEIAREPARRPWWRGSAQAWSAAAAVLVLFAVVVLAVVPEFGTFMHPTYQTIENEKAERRIPSIDERTGKMVQLPSPSTGLEREDARPPVALEAPKPTTLKERSADVTADKEAPALTKTETAAVPHEPAVQSELRRATSPRAEESRDRAVPNAATANRAPEFMGYNTREGQINGSQIYGQSQGVPGYVVQQEAGIRTQAPSQPAPAPAMAPAPATPAPGVTGGLDAAGGAASQAKGQASAATAELEKKLKDSPNNEALLIKLLEAYRKQGRTADAYAIAQRLTQLQPKNPDYWFIRGELAEAVKIPQDASSSYKLAIRNNLSRPRRDEASSRLGALKD